MLKLAFIVFAFCTIGAMAQPDSSRVQRIGMSYFSEGGLYPGFTFNYEKKLLANNRFQLLLASKAGAYFHYQNHTGIFAMVQSGQRFRVYKHFYFEHFLGVGYLVSFLNGGDAFFVNAAGQVQKANRTGNSHFMPSVSGGFSYDHRGKQSFIIFARPMLFWQIPLDRKSVG